MIGATIAALLCVLTALTFIVTASAKSGGGGGSGSGSGTLTIGGPAPTTTATTPTTPATTTTPSTTTTPTPTTPPTVTGQVRVRFVLEPHFHGSLTKLRRAEIEKLPVNARVGVSVAGPHHPQLKYHLAKARHARRLLRALTTLIFHPHDRLRFVVSVPHRHSERLQLTFRNAQAPVATLLNTYKQRLITPLPRAPRHGAAVRVSLAIRARYGSTGTRLLAIAPRTKLPAHARITVSDSGPRHPTLAPHRVSVRRAGALFRALTRTTFAPDDRLFLTISAPQARAEHLRLTFRNGRAPAVKLL